MKKFILLFIISLTIGAAISQQNYIGNSINIKGQIPTADGKGTVFYSATVKCRAYTFSGVLVKLGITDFKITNVVYKGIDAKNVANISFPVTVNNIRLDISTTLIFSKPGSPYKRSFNKSYTAVGKGSMEDSYLSDSEASELKKAFNIQKPNPEFYQLKIQLYNTRFTGEISSWNVKELQTIIKQIEQYIEKQEQNNSNSSSSSNYNQNHSNTGSNYQYSQNNQSSSNTSAHSSKGTNDIAAIHNKHVAQNNSRYYANNQSTTQTGNTSDYTTKTSQENQVNQWQNESNRFWEDFEAQQRAQQEKLQRIEYNNKDNVVIISSHIASIQSVKINNASSIAQAKSPQEVLAKLAEIKYQVKQKHQQIDASFTQTMALLQSKTVSSVEEANSNTVTAVAAGIATIAGHIQADQAEKKAREEAEAKMKSFYYELYNSYDKAKKEFLNQAVYTTSQSIEDYSMEQYFYLKCIQNDMEERFSYTSASWATPSYRCSEPQAPANYSNQSENNYQIATRKINLYKKYNYEPFKDIGLSYARKAIAKNQNKQEALVLVALNTDDIIQKYSSLLYANSINPKAFNHHNELTAARNEFSNKFYQSIDNEDVSFLTQANKYTLYPQQKSNSETPLQYSVRKNKLKSFTYLLQNTENLSTDQKKDLLVLAAKSNAVNIISYLISSQEVPFTKSKSNYPSLSPIEAAFYNNSKDAFVLLLKKGAQTENIRQKINNTEAFNFQMAQLLLYAAIQTQNQKYIIEADNYMRLSDNEYFKIIEASIKSPNKSNEILAARIKNKNITNSQGQSLPLLAIKNNNYSLLKVLIDNNFNLNIKDKKGVYPALYLLDLPEHSLIIRNFENIPINLDITDKNGIPFIILALYKQRDFFDKYFINPTLNINATGLYGWTILHYAAREGDVNSVKKIMLHPNISYCEIDNYNRNAYKIAKERTHSKITGEIVTNADYKEITKLLKPFCQSNNPELFFLKK